MLTVALSLMLLGVFLAPAVILCKLDCFNILVNCHFRNILNPDFKRLYNVVRYVVIQWVTLESSRVYIVATASILTKFSITVNCLNNLKSRKLSRSSINLYHQLFIINQNCMFIIRQTALCLLGMGFVMLVLLNFVVIVGWKLYNHVLYFGALVFAIMTYVILTQTLPRIIACSQAAEELINLWKYNLTNLMTGGSYWKRLVKAQQPMCFYYGTAKIDKETKVNYYSNLITYTLNLLLIR